MIAVGELVGGRFRIDAILGAGGMGVVAAATHLELGHRVAIKFLRDEMADNPTLVDRFLREARAVVHLRTEHVCRVSDVGHTAGGTPYIVMELLEGTDLQRVVARQPLPPAFAATYVVQACVALAEAHAAGIIHRDLKPANLFVTRRLDGTPLVKVLDFGIAKALAETGAHLTYTQGAMGSPGYISPEQLKSARDVDVRTDVWALGVTLYQLLAARLPFAGDTPLAIAVKVATEPPAPLDVEPRLRAVVLRCLEKPQDRRYPDVAALAAELAPFGGPAALALVPTIQVLAHPAGRAPAPLTSPAPTITTAPTGGSAAAPPAAGAAATAPHTRRRWPVAVAALAVVVAGGVAVAVALRGGAPRAAPPDATRIAASQADAAAPPTDAAAAAAPIDAAAAAPGSAAAADDRSDALFGGGDVGDASGLLGSAVDIAAVMKQAHAAMGTQCKLAAGKSDVGSLVTALICACTDKDATRAAAIWPRIKIAKANLRQLCAMTGVALP